jgi:hypothetical protein
MELDDFQQRWLAQDRRIDEALRLNKRLWLRAELAAPRVSLRWVRVGALLNMLAGALCLLWTGAFIAANIHEPRFVVPAVALHLWLVAALATTIARFVKASAINYEAPVVTIQRQIEALRALTVRSTMWLFLFGVPIWFVPFCIVAMRSWFGVDLYRWFGGDVLLESFAWSVAGGVALWAVGRRVARWATGRRVARGVAGRYLTKAEDQIAAIAAFEREE